MMLDLSFFIFHSQYVTMRYIGNRFINPSETVSDDCPYFQRGSVFCPGGECQVLIYSSLDTDANVTFWYAPR